MIERTKVELFAGGHRCKAPARGRGYIRAEARTLTTSPFGFIVRSTDRNLPMHALVLSGFIFRRGLCSTHTLLDVLLLNTGQHASRGWVRARTPCASLLTAAARSHCKSPVALIPYVPEGHGEQTGFCSR